MAIPDDLKFDVRVRDRLLSRGLVTEAEIEKHVKALPDLEGQAVELTPKQPALQKESDRDIVIVKTSGIRPPVTPINRDEIDLPIDDDDDEEEETAAVKAKKLEKVAAKPVEESAEEADEDEDDDEDDEDDEDDDEADEAEEGETGGGEPGGAEPAGGEPDGAEKAETPKKEDDWGAG